MNIRTLGVHNVHIWIRLTISILWLTIGVVLPVRIVSRHVAVRRWDGVPSRAVVDANDDDNNNSNNDENNKNNRGYDPYQPTALWRGFWCWSSSFWRSRTCLKKLFEEISKNEVFGEFPAQ